MTNQFERQVILATLQSIVDDGLRYSLRALPPPGGGWLVHIKESELQEMSDHKREGLLIRLTKAINHMNTTNEIPVGVLRTLE